jgi:hypothetical protein
MRLDSLHVLLFPSSTQKQDNFSQRKQLTKPKYYEELFLVPRQIRVCTHPRARRLRVGQNRQLART